MVLIHKGKFDRRMLLTNDQLSIINKNGLYWRVDPHENARFGPGIYQMRNLSGDSHWLGKLLASQSLYASFLQALHVCFLHR